MCQWVPLILSPSGFVWVEPFTHSRSRGTPSRVIRADMEWRSALIAPLNTAMVNFSPSSPSTWNSALRSPAAGMTNSFSTEFFTSAMRRSASSCESV